MRKSAALFAAIGLTLAPAAAQAADAVRPAVVSVAPGAPLGTALGGPARAGVARGKGSKDLGDDGSVILFAAAAGVGAFFLSHAVWSNTKHRCVSPGTGERVSCRNN